MKRCPNGHLPIRIGKFCTECGAETIEVPNPKCPQCAEDIGEFQQYCASCGTQLKATNEISTVKLSDMQQELNARITALEKKVREREKKLREQNGEQN